MVKFGGGSVREEERKGGGGGEGAGCVKRKDEKGKKQSCGISDR